MRVGLQVLGLRAVLVGAENEPLLVRGFEEDHTGVRSAVGADGREGHGRWVSVAGVLRFLIPEHELIDWIGEEIFAAQASLLVFHSVEAWWVLVHFARLPLAREG